MSEKRVLRKRDSSEGDHNLFNFDHLNPYVINEKPIRISKSNKKLQEYHYSEDSKLPTIAQRDSKIERASDSILESPRKSKLRSDPLDDLVYVGFHRSMTKREIGMANHDNLKVLSDIEVLTSQKRMLTQYNWTANITKITKINDVKDQDELIRKRDLTIAEINKRLVKYQNWKKRQEQLKNEVKLHEHSISTSNEDEYTMPMEELKKIRRKERLETYGGTLKIILNNGYYLLIDPVAPPVIQKDDTFSLSSLTKHDMRRKKQSVSSLLQTAKIPKVRAAKSNVKHSSTKSTINPKSRRVKPKNSNKKHKAKKPITRNGSKKTRVSK